MKLLHNTSTFFCFSSKKRSLTFEKRYVIEAINHLLWDLQSFNCPFSEVTIIFGSNFQQILFIISYVSRADIVHASIQASSLWKHFKILRLRRNMYVTDDSNCYMQTTHIVVDR